jgi:hypothetical protein
MYIIASINYGKGAGINVSSITLSELILLNIITLFIFINKILFHNFKIIMGFLGLVFLISLILCYFLFMHKARYKQIISHFESTYEKSLTGTLCFLFYFLASFLLFVVVFSIKI